MSTYVIGDVHGCFRELIELLDLVHFDSVKDRLYFVGDIVNRGPNSLEVLRFIKSLHTPIVVLGNHDLLLLILGYDLAPENAYKHTLHDILKTVDKMELLEWLRYCPLVHYEKNNNAFLVHAGLPPQWSIIESLQRANEISVALQGKYFKDFLGNLFKDEPSEWNNSLKGQDRLRYITNAFTRMRFCNEQGKLSLNLKINKKTSTHEEQHVKPWFTWWYCKQSNVKKTDIFFGHWAALDGACNTSNCYALDTGCSWGRRLTALKLENRQRFSVPCRTFTYKNHKDFNKDFNSSI
ncbi:symmetrical bis(5'-nucleosyl)-tetraphosphatase [Coxiella-like endosymbiont of Amblyomma americanum]|uniref:symmetrical bis(5'-nucleosyl)-tetraphosphatase n=1 Tax=Coxiella-like endosymbiont of Amblyomma americanum TaxID=1987500 RepID=UPI000F89E917|nr:symmetrical bis(5'-nucleosyl)-tetraphosphatase [Coxiella-like endosymbiont of Amblyomma americanum]AUJ58707.1 bis(5'-nucleosyl)-tetraphosphatase (symmetrical) [Coxiella-like endosymbiont of Amblyomma americanum]